MDDEELETVALVMVWLTALAVLLAVALTAA
jgi:hypothetical protein